MSPPRRRSARLASSTKVSLTMASLLFWEKNHLTFFFVDETGSAYFGGRH